MKTEYIIYLLLYIGLMIAGCEKEYSEGDLDIIPEVPSGLSASAASSTQINLSWKDNSDNEEGFIVERAVGDNPDFTKIDTLDENTTGYQNLGLSPSTKYSFRIFSFNSAGNSGYTQIVNSRTQDPPVTIPIAPSDLKATAVSSSTINLSWKDNSDNEEGFELERAIGSSDNFIQIAKLAANENSYQNKGLTSSTQFRYRIRAYNSAGNSSFSYIAAAISETPVPSVPSNLLATAVSGSQINLTWNDNSNNESGFKVERSETGAQYYEIKSLSANSTSYKDEGLDPSSTHAYRIRAYNNEGHSGYSNVSTAKTESGLNNPPDIESVTNPTGPFAIYISYDWPSDMTVYDHYQLEESTVSPTSGFVNIHNSENTHESPYPVVLERSPGTYYYRARIAYGAPGSYSEYSNVESVTVTEPPRSITLINNGSTSVMLKDVVQVKVARYLADVYQKSDLLTDDPAQCLSLPGESIAPGESMTFDINIGPEYTVFLGMGIWETDMFFCPASYPWSKRRYFTDTTTRRKYFVWTCVSVNGHDSGNRNWTIEGDYLKGTLHVIDHQGGPNPFTRTNYDPINK